MNVASSFNKVFKTVPFCAASEAHPFRNFYMVENCGLAIFVLCYSEKKGDIWVGHIRACISSPCVNITKFKGKATISYTRDGGGHACGQGFDIENVRSFQETSKFGATIVSLNMLIKTPDSIKGHLNLDISEMAFELAPDGTPVLYEDITDDEEGDDCESSFFE